MRRSMRPLRRGLAREFVRARPPRRRNAHRAPSGGTPKWSEVPHRPLLRHRSGDARRDLRRAPPLRPAAARHCAIRSPSGRRRLRDRVEPLAVDRPVAHLVRSQDWRRRERVGCRGDPFSPPRCLRRRPRARACSSPTAHAGERRHCERRRRRRPRPKRPCEPRCCRGRNRPPCRRDGCRRHVRGRGHAHLPGPASSGSRTWTRPLQRTSTSTAPSVAAFSASI